MSTIVRDHNKAGLEAKYIQMVAYWNRCLGRDLKLRREMDGWPNQPRTGEKASQDKLISEIEGLVAQTEKDLSEIRNETFDIRVVREGYGYPPDPQAPYIFFERGLGGGVNLTIHNGLPETLRQDNFKCANFGPIDSSNFGALVPWAVGDTALEPCSQVFWVVYMRDNTLPNAQEIHDDPYFKYYVELERRLPYLPGTLAPDDSREITIHSASSDGCVSVNTDDENPYDNGRYIEALCDEDHVRENEIEALFHIIRQYGEHKITITDVPIKQGTPD